MHSTFLNNIYAYPPFLPHSLPPSLPSLEPLPARQGHRPDGRGQLHDPRPARLPPGGKEGRRERGRGGRHMGESQTLLLFCVISRATKFVFVTSPPSLLPSLPPSLPPQRIDQLERALLQLEVEATALQREDDAQSKARLNEVCRHAASFPPSLPSFFPDPTYSLFSFLPLSLPPYRWRRRWPPSRTSCSPSNSATKPRRAR